VRSPRRERRLSADRVHVQRIEPRGLGGGKRDGRSLEAEEVRSDPCRRMPNPKGLVGASIEAGDGTARREDCGPVGVQRISAPQTRKSVDDFLRGLWQQGGLQGTTADDAYFLRFEPSIVSQRDVDLGRLIILIGFAPVRPAECVIIRLTIIAKK
jgi:hypothetical protein